MFTTHLEKFKFEQEALHRQAARYRLLKSIKKSRSLQNRVIKRITSLRGNTGQRIGAPAQAAR